MVFKSDDIERGYERRVFMTEKPDEIRDSVPITFVSTKFGGPAASDSRHQSSRILLRRTALERAPFADAFETPILEVVTAVAELTNVDAGDTSSSESKWPSACLASFSLAL